MACFWTDNVMAREDCEDGGEAVISFVNQSGDGSSSGAFRLRYRADFVQDESICTVELFDALTIALSVSVVGVALSDVEEGDGLCGQAIPDGVEFTAVSHPMTPSDGGDGAEWYWYNDGSYTSQQWYWVIVLVDGVEYQGAMFMGSGI